MPRHARLPRLPSSPGLHYYYHRSPVTPPPSHARPLVFTVVPPFDFSDLSPRILDYADAVTPRATFICRYAAQFVTAAPYARPFRVFDYAFYATMPFAFRLADIDECSPDTASPAITPLISRPPRFAMVLMPRKVRVTLVTRHAARFNIYGAENAHAMSCCRAARLPGSATCA